ncbi:hypothetical protein LEMLEM_LOCUS6602 [Lemmus lemmus]
MANKQTIEGGGGGKEHCLLKCHLLEWAVCEGRGLSPVCTPVRLSHVDSFSTSILLLGL